MKKTQSEGEEALRVLIVALNGIAAISMLKQEFSEAVSLYKEALNITEENAEDFRLDPLLNIHILHNLAEILPLVQSHKRDVRDEDHHRAAKRQRINELDSSTHASSSESGLKKDVEYHEECKTLDTVCETLKVKYLSSFNSNLSKAQQEFTKSYDQVTCTKCFSKEFLKLAVCVSMLHC